MLKEGHKIVDNKVCEVCGRSEKDGYKINSDNCQFNMFLCIKCYQQKLRDGVKDKENPRKCFYCDKDETVDYITTKKCKFGLQLCKQHYNEMITKGEVTSNLPKHCSVCGVSDKEGYQVYSENNKFKKPLCSKHYQQLYKHGRVFRTIYEPNEIIEYEDYAEICLYNRKGKEVARTKIDLEDIDKVKDRKWFFKDGYVASGGKRKENNLRLHRYIMGVENEPSKVYIDHKDHNTLNNRKENLRVCNNSKNQMNKRIPKNNTSGFKGVSFHKLSGKWRVRITIDGETHYLGLFEDKEDAIKTRIEAEEEYFGEFRFNADLIKEGEDI